jgi:hypothetical protein
MTEEDWLTCEDPAPMLDFLRGEASERKLRLFACAACRRVWDDMGEVWSREAVEAAEQFADGLMSEREVESFSSGASDEMLTALADQDERKAGFAFAASSTAAVPLFLGDRGTARAVLSTLSDGDAVGITRQVALFRDIFGNPFRPVAFDPAWRTPTAVALAEQMYAGRDFGAMPILADALQEAGCDNADVLSHCRAPGEHVRGCWVVDLVLGKE